MNPERKSLDATAIATLVLLCALWGIQQTILKATAGQMSPTLQIGLRSGIGCVLLAVLMKFQGTSLALQRGPWLAGLFAGALFAAEFLFIGEGLKRTTASHVVVFLNTAPIFTALGLHFLIPEERLGWAQWLGVGACFSGIAIAFLGGLGHGPFDPTSLWGDLLGLLSGASWGATTVIIRSSKLSDIPATQTTLYQLLCSFVALTAFSVVLGEHHAPWTPVLAASVIGQGVVIAFFSLVTWFWLMTRYLASRLVVFTFLSPLLGVGFGVWLLGEPLTPEFVWGAALVLTGVIVVNAAPRRQAQ